MRDTLPGDIRRSELLATYWKGYPIRIFLKLLQIAASSIDSRKLLRSLHGSFGQQSRHSPKGSWTKPSPPPHTQSTRENSRKRTGLKGQACLTPHTHTQQKKDPFRLTAIPPSQLQNPNQPHNPLHPSQPIYYLAS